MRDPIGKPNEPKTTTWHRVLLCSTARHNLESVAASALGNHGLVRGVPKVTLSSSTGVGGDGGTARARVNLSPRGTEVVDGASTVVKLLKKMRQEMIANERIGTTQLSIVIKPNKAIHQRRNKCSIFESKDDARTINPGTNTHAAEGHTRQQVMNMTRLTRKSEIRTHE